MSEGNRNTIDANIFNESLQALADLALIEDGHPSHSTTDGWNHDSPEVRPDKSEQIEGWITEFRESLCAAVGPEGKADAENAAKSLETILYLLATYSFDSSRRFAIMHFALQPIGKKKTPNKFFAQSIKDDDEAINHTDFSAPACGVDGWKQRAKVAWKRLDAWHDSIKDRASAHLKSALL